MIIVCAWCNMVRIAKNWVNGETVDPEGREFSHGICPDCAKKWTKSN